MVFSGPKKIRFVSLTAVRQGQHKINKKVDLCDFLNNEFVNRHVEKYAHCT